MKTSELIGAALDWAVAKCEGAYSVNVDTDIDGTKRVNYGGMYPEWSTDWAHGGPIIEREGISLVYDVELCQEEGQEYYATSYAVESGEGRIYGPTPLIAAMRCYVASKLGDEVDVPDELA
jgi:hypothetical protein